MLEALVAAVDEVDIPVDGPSLRCVLRLLDRLTAKASVAVGDFDAAQLWDLDGATSMIGWLRTEAGMTSQDASRTTRTARRMRSWPVTGQAWVDGTLSGGHVTAVTANITTATAGLWAEQEASMVPALAELPVADAALVLRTWQARAKDSLDEEDPPEPDQSLHLSRLLDGRGALTGDLDAETTDVVSTALRLAETPDTDEEPSRTPARRRADALADVARFFLDHHRSGKTSGRHRPHLNIVVDLDRRTAGDPAAGQTIDGMALEAETIARLLCDCGIHRVVTSGGSTILDYGRTTRTIPAPLFNALVLRDRHCRWPGCDRPSTWCEGHHLAHWEHGGETSLPNLVLLCSRHHHRAHTPGWHPTLHPDGTFQVTTPTGSTRTTRPPPR